MMDWLRDYLSSVVAAAVICSVLGTILNKNSSISQVFRLLSGLFMAITVISPFLHVPLSNISGIFTHADTQSHAWVSQGEEYAHEQLCAFITEQTTTYILDKASSLGLQIKTELTLSTGGEPVPWSVKLFGEASPYARQQLMYCIETDLGIPKERQSWN